MSHRKRRRRGFHLKAAEDVYREWVSPRSGGLDNRRRITYCSAPGARPGYAVVQCYVQDQVASVTLPVRQLKGFRKLFLQSGEERVASFRLTREDLSFYDASGRLRFEPGRFTLWLGQDCQHGLQATFTLE